MVLREGLEIEWYCDFDCRRVMAMARIQYEVQYKRWHWRGPSVSLALDSSERRAAVQADRKNVNGR